MSIIGLGDYSFGEREVEVRGFQRLQCRAWTGVDSTI